jgi:hypothetical protein
VVFLFALSVVVDDLLVQRTGLQRRKHRCSSTARHLILGIGLSWACTRAPRASCTGRGASETGPHVRRVPTAIAPLKDIEDLQYIFVLSGTGSCPGPSRVLPGSSAAPLGSNWQLAVACQASSSLAQREPARSTGGDRPGGTDMKRVAAARTTGRYRKPVPGTPKHTGGSRSHAHGHRSQWREPLAPLVGSTGLETTSRPQQHQRRGRGHTGLFWRRRSNSPQKPDF